MIQWLVGGAIIVAAMFFLPWLMSLMPRTHKGGGGSVMGPALGELNAIFNPAERHVEEARRQLPAERENGEPPDPEG